MMKVLQIGCGRWGETVSKAIQNDANLDLVGIHTRTPIDNALYCKNLDLILADQSVKAVIITTPLKNRHKIILQCLEAGKHVLTEKPLAENVLHAQSLIKKASDQALTLYTNYTHAHSLLIKLLCDEISGKTIDFIKITMSQCTKASDTETVDTLLFSHMLAVLYNLSSSQLKSISTNSIVLNNKHEILVQTDCLRLYANTRCSEIKRVIEVCTNGQKIYVDFSNDGFLSVSTNELSTYRKTMDQSSNLQYVFNSFYEACKSRNLGNYKQSIAVQYVLDRL